MFCKDATKLLKHQKCQIFSPTKTIVDVYTRWAAALVVLIKRQQYDYHIFWVSSTSRTSNTSKIETSGTSFLPPSIYYKVLIFNAIKYLQRSQFSLSPACRAICVHLKLRCVPFFYVIPDKFRCWYFHVS